MRSRSKSSTPIDPRPVMPKGSDDHEEKIIERDFTSVFKQITDVEWDSEREKSEYVYRVGFIAGKNHRSTS